MKNKTNAEYKDDGGLFIKHRRGPQYARFASECVKRRRHSNHGQSVQGTYHLPSEYFPSSQVSMIIPSSSGIDERQGVAEHTLCIMHRQRNCSRFNPVTG
uniref:Uncharacterized protein n=1 Tax=Schistocephalus solidus TaxID=70667 RepID=A0A0X3P4J9_SCHSO